MHVGTERYDRKRLCFGQEQAGMKEILYGNYSMIACVICYLAWWGITFKPPAPESSLIGNAFLAGAFVFGLAGIFTIIHAITKMMTQPETHRFISLKAIMIAGIVSYIVLLMVSSKLLHRQVTSELFIIIGWTVLELCLVGTVYRFGNMVITSLTALFAGIIVAAVLSLVCYLLYYKLEYVKGYYDGMIPLILTGVMMVIINVVSGGVRK